MRISSCLPHPTVMIRLRLLHEAEPYSSAYPAAEDYELFWRLLGRTRAASIPEPLTTTSVSAAGISATRRRTQLWSKLRLQCHHFDPRKPESYVGVFVTLSFFLIPRRLIGGVKRLIGVSRY